MPLPDASFSRRFVCAQDSGVVPRGPAGRDWAAYMEVAIEEAKRALLAGEVPVGAILLDACGSILGRGHNSRIHDCDISAHAEINALRCAGRALGTYRFPKCIMLVTLEPCAMCAHALLDARVAGIVFGVLDKDEGAIVSRAEYLDPPCAHSHTVWHLGGICKERCYQLLADFFAACRHGDVALRK